MYPYVLLALSVSSSITPIRFSSVLFKKGQSLNRWHHRSSVLSCMRRVLVRCGHVSLLDADSFLKRLQFSQLGMNPGNDTNTALLAIPVVSRHKRNLGKVILWSQAQAAVCITTRHLTLTVLPLTFIMTFIVPFCQLDEHVLSLLRSSALKFYCARQLRIAPEV
jgi:hypothetical protein